MGVYWQCINSLKIILSVNEGSYIKLFPHYVNPARDRTQHMKAAGVSLQPVKKTLTLITKQSALQFNTEF